MKALIRLGLSMGLLAALKSFVRPYECLKPSSVKGPSSFLGLDEALRLGLRDFRAEET